MKIVALNLINNKNVAQKQQLNSFEKVENKNDFEFSSSSSKAIKSAIMPNISFGISRKITRAEVDRKEIQVRKEAIKAHGQLQNMYYILAPQWLKEAQELHSMAKADMDKLNSKDIRIVRGSDGRKPATLGFIKYDLLKRPLYAVDLKADEIQRITSFKIDGDNDCVVEIDSRNDVVSSYQKGLNVDGSYDFKMTYFKNEEGNLVADVYTQGHVKDKLGYSYFDKVMMFCSENQMTYKEGVDKCLNIQEPNGTREAIEFDFYGDNNNFICTKGYQIGGGTAPAKRGEVVRINDGRLTYWSKGHEIFPDGIEVKGPSITFKNGNVVEYDMGYKLNSVNNQLQRHNYIKDYDGISSEMLRALGYFKG